MSAVVIYTDPVSLGNIESSLGRIEIRAGKYLSAITHFQEAMQLFERLDSRHPNLARAMAGLGVAARLCARRMQRELDVSEGRNRKKMLTDFIERIQHLIQDVARDRKHVDLRDLLSATDVKQFLRTVCDKLFLQCWEEDIGKRKKEITRYWRRADLAFDTAQGIYTDVGDSQGLEKVHLYRAELLLDRGPAHFAGAEEYIHKAVSTAKLIVARRKLLECKLANRIADETTDDEDHESQLRHGLDSATEGLQEAPVQNRRLMAKLYCARGLTEMNSISPNVAAARKDYFAAAEKHGNSSHDEILEDLEELKAKLLTHLKPDERLRALSHGEVEGELQDLLGEVETILILKVYEREGCDEKKTRDRLRCAPAKIKAAVRAAARARDIQYEHHP